MNWPTAFAIVGVSFCLMLAVIGQPRKKDKSDDDNRNY